MQYIITLIFDILILALISYTCGGINSSITLLLIIPVAVGSILFQSKKFSIFLAAIATIIIFYTEFYLFFSRHQEEIYYFQAGLLGILLFLISLLLQYLSNLIRKNELIAIKQAENIQALEEMNDQVIQRMQTGIIVIDTDNKILKANSSAHKLLLQDIISSLPEHLVLELIQWRINSNHFSKPFRVNKSSPQVQASFSFLHPEEGSNILIFLEDFSLISSKVQQLKLMSLGRLTASIAHEIRNPLGAISHASQLLNESTSLAQSDQRLLEIIDTHTKRVNSIIENIMQLSRNNETSPETISLYSWLDNFIQKFSSSLNEKVKIQLSKPKQNINARFNPSQLEQIMNNLCENALRANLKKSQQAYITVRVSINSSNANPMIDVIDEGDGISKENEEKIFEPFFTTENTGTGLGLFICKEICEANQAQLSYRRIDNKLTCFSLSFAHPDRNIA